MATERRSADNCSRYKVRIEFAGLEGELRLATARCFKPLDGGATHLGNQMSAIYPLHLERQIHRRWLHRLKSIDRPVPLGRPNHPNDVRPPRKRSHDRRELLRKPEFGAVAPT